MFWLVYRKLHALCNVLLGDEWERNYIDERNHGSKGEWSSMCLPSGKEHQKRAVHLKREEERAPKNSSRYNHIWFDFSCVNICNFSYMITPFFTIEVCPLNWMKLTSSYTIERCYFLFCRLSFLVLLLRFQE